jgi:acyl carrier protein
MPTAMSARDRKSIVEFVIEEIAATGADPGEISLAATLESLGLDSLDVVELSQRVKRELGIPVGPKDFGDAVTISDAVAVICDKAGIG